MLENELGWIDWLIATSLIAIGLASACCAARAVVRNAMA